jgi:hypothetical protein
MNPFFTAIVKARPRDAGLASHPRRGSVWEKIVKTTLLRASLLLGASLWAGSAMAQDSDSFTVESNVAPFCSELSVSSAPMNLGSLTGPTGQIVPNFDNAIENQRELATSFYCNAPSTVTIRATPLTTTNTTTDTSSFTSRVDYTATLDWDDFEGQVSSTVAAGAILPVTTATIGSMTLKLSDPTVPNNLRPVAGDYSGQVTLTIALAQ